MAWAKIMKHRLLIVEDDEFVLNLLATCLAKENYEVRTATSGKAMYSVLDGEDIDLMLLDLTLPDEDGLVLARQVRTRSSMPIIVLTSRDEQADRLAALDIGADDYLTKPCDVTELSLRVRNLLARAGTPETAEVFAFEGWSLDVGAGTLTSPVGQDVILSRTEFDLLTALVRASNRVRSRTFLIDAVSRGGDGASERMIDVLVSRLRKRLERDRSKPRLIVTVPGRGYKFIAEPPATR